MKKAILIVTVMLSITALQVRAQTVDSLGFSVAPIASYDTSGLTDGTFPTSFFMIGDSGNWRLEYLTYKPNLISSDNIDNRLYENSAVLAFYNAEFLLRARRGTVLGRTRLYLGAGLGLFRSRVNDAVSDSEFNPGVGGIGGFRYFFDKQVYMGGEAKLLATEIKYTDSRYKNENIGGLFFTLLVGFRFGA